MNPARPGLYWRTLRHLRFEQIRYLVWRRLLRMPRRVPVPHPIEPHYDVALDCCVPLVRPCRLGGRRFRFLNQERDFGAHVDWQAPGESRLWQYNLHYFDWLRQVDCDPQTALTHIEEWIDANPPFAGTGWEPYPLSLRLVNWLSAIARLPTAERLSPRVAESIALQAAWLLENLEFQLGANHLFVNIKALLFAAAFVSGDLARRLRERGSALLARELGKQFLADGGHYERSPTYHALLTQDLLELAALCARRPELLPPAIRRSISEAATRALSFAYALRTPDDAVFLFNDAARHVAPAYNELASFASAHFGFSVPVASEDRVLDALTASGYYVVRERDDVVVFDCGEVGPASQPGHAHCDTLSFELYLDGRRIVTNSGNHDYERGPQRAYARSTRAHTTVEIDGIEQSEIWSAFRVGRRARPLYGSLEQVGDAAIFRGAHDGYHHLPGRVTHAREARIGAGFELTVTDRISGLGTHQAVSWLHFAPDLVALPFAAGFHVCDATGSVLAAIDAIVCGGVEVVETPRYPEFGVETRGASLRFAATGALPLSLGYTIRRTGGHRSA